ncbi:MAG: hypothetical protein DHS20C15_19260 [Planctomycetota bacterium]|nr:MAG: hypothetical protein DHS20C15_19260 [Planctomycetota bacterium]
MWNNKTLPRSNQKQPLPRLRDSEVTGIQHPPGKAHGVASGIKFANQLVKEAPMAACGQALHILKHKVRSIQLGDHSYEIADKAIPGIIQHPPSDHRESLAGRAAKHDIYCTL